MQAKNFANNDPILLKIYGGVPHSGVIWGREILFYFSFLGSKSRFQNFGPENDFFSTLQNFAQTARESDGEA